MIHSLMQSPASCPLPPAFCCLLLCSLLLASCAPDIAAEPALVSRPTPTAFVIVAVVGPTLTAAPPPASATPIPDATLGIAETLATYLPTEDPEGSKGEALATLRDFADPNGVYRSAWWFADDGAADIYEVLAVVFQTEGNLNVQVQQVVAARYLWYCGGIGAGCSGSALINFLSYFQPWREPWTAGQRFANAKAQDFVPFAQDLVLQRPGILTALIPGADTYIRDPNSLAQRTSIDWPNTPFHFANVHPTWDTYLRQTLGRGPNGANRLWVLTMTEASQVCPSSFVCENMTKERQ
ncbi:MAG TPA: hypothetical protein VJL59_11405 [Anaerolineales bacterium]|nr:hypothetical protein [Anaerolineales bacterium]